MCDSCFHVDDDDDDREKFRVLENTRTNMDFVKRERTVFTFPIFDFRIYLSSNQILID